MIRAPQSAHEQQGQRIESADHVLHYPAPHELCQAAAKDPVDRLLWREADVLLDVGPVDKGRVCSETRED